MIATEGSVLSVHEFNNSWIGVELLNDGFWFYSLLIVYTCLLSLSLVFCTVDFCSFTIRNYAELYHSSIKILKIWGSYNLVFDWYSLIILRVKIVFKLFFSYNYVLHTGKLIGLIDFWIYCIKFIYVHWDMCNAYFMHTVKIRWTNVYFLFAS